MPKEKVTWKFSPTENRFGFSKDFILFWSKSYWKFIPVFHLYVKWREHIVLPMSVIFQLSPLFFAILWDIIDLIFGMWVYNNKLQIKFTFRSGPLDFGQIFSCHHFFRYAWRYWLDFWHMQASTLTYFSTCPFGQLTKKVLVRLNLLVVRKN